MFGVKTICDCIIIVEFNVVLDVLVEYNLLGVMSPGALSTRLCLIDEELILQGKKTPWSEIWGNDTNDGCDNLEKK